MPPQLAEMFKDKKKLVYFGAGFVVVAAVVLYFSFSGPSESETDTATTTTTKTMSSSTAAPGGSADKESVDQKAISEAERLLKKLDKDFSSVPEDYVKFLVPNEGIPVVVSDLELFVIQPFQYLSSSEDREGEAPPGEEVFVPVETAGEGAGSEEEPPAQEFPEFPEFNSGGSEPVSQPVPEEQPVLEPEVTMPLQ